MGSTSTARLKSAARLPQQALIQLCRGILAAWHYLISPLFGPRCRFYPSCSEYASEALLEHGLFKGAVLGIKRVFRCHPFCEGGVDLVPESSGNIPNNAKTGFQNN